MVRGNYSSMIIQDTNQVVPLPRESQVISPLLYDYLTCITPHGHEKKIHKFLPFMDNKDLNIEIDKVGNIIVKVGTFRQDFRTVFSCHMDTMHWATDVDTEMHLCMTSKANLTEVPKDFKEGLVYARKLWNVTINGVKETRWSPMILGADDKIGMYIMTRMIENKIPGMYIFHVGEEKGGVGSNYIREHTPKIFKGMRKAIAFDRMHYGDVITTQGRQTCSDEFAKSLASELNKNLPPFERFAPCTGIWTDTANYKYIIHECSNISVGYFDQHTTNEHFDLVWLESMLLPAIMKVNWESIDIKRDKVKAKEEDEKVITHTYIPTRNTSTKDEWVALKDITQTTPNYKIPDWKPSDGVPEGATPIALERLAEKWMLYNNSKMQAAKELAELVKKVAMLEGANAAYRNFIAKAKPFHVSPSFNDPAVKRTRLHTKCDLLIKSTALWWREVTSGHISGLDDKDVKKIDQIGDTAATLMAQVGTIKRDPVNVTATLEYQLNRNMFDYVMGASSYRYANASLANSLEDVMRYIRGNLDEPVFTEYKEHIKVTPPLPVIASGNSGKGG
jgi:hypothetical protein